MKKEAKVRVARNKIKKIGGSVARRTVSHLKGVAVKHPRIKHYGKKVISLVTPRQQVGYDTWVAQNFPDAIECVKLRNESRTFSYRPLISIVTPVYNPEISFLRECIESVQAQVYDNWQLCLVDDASTNDEVRKVMREYAENDHRIICKFRKKNGHISKASNDAVAIAEGEFVALLDNDDILWPNALYEVVRALNQNKELDFIYSDEDKITEDRHEHLGPFFKPDWNPDFLRSVNYITHFAVIRKEIVQNLGGFRSKYDGAQDWDLFLRVSRETQKILHVPKILYSWRISDTSTAKETSAKPYIVEAQKKALEEDALKEENVPDILPGVINDYWQIRYPVVGEPLVSIVIPTKNQYKIVKRCVESILEKTTYKNYEIILVDTGSTDRKVGIWYKRLTQRHDNIRIVEWPGQPFSYARSCNEGVRQARGEYLMILNNDTEVVTPNWLEVMLGDAQRDEVGAVGCKLYYPDGFHIQHGGVIIGPGEVAANALSMCDKDNLTPVQHLYANTRHNMSAVTAACVMIKKERFDEVDGFDEKFRVTFNDVDLCLRLLKKGYLNVYTPHVELLHHESISVGRPEQKRKRDTKEMAQTTKLFRQRWGAYIKNDPNFNPNFTRNDASFNLRELS